MSKKVGNKLMGKNDRIDTIVASVLREKLLKIEGFQFKDLAEKLNISANDVSRKLLGVSQMYYIDVFLICKLNNISVNDVFKEVAKIVKNEGENNGY